MTMLSRGGTTIGTFSFVVISDTAQRRSSPEEFSTIEW
jgi:hypothetical protein